MYFSLITPSPGQERAAAHDWLRHADAYREHQWLWRFFPAPADTPRDFLFRRLDADALPRFYVVSARPPAAPEAAWQVQSRSYRPQLAVGSRLAFQLRANPTVARRGADKATRHDVVMDEKHRLLAARGLQHWRDWLPDRRDAAGQSDPRPALYEIVTASCARWLDERAAAHGFSVDLAQLRVDSYQQQRGKQRLLRFSTVDFSGELCVTDPARFATALTHGIGRAKAFGCGLLLVRPAD